MQLAVFVLAVADLQLAVFGLAEAVLQLAWSFQFIAQRLSCSLLRWFLSRAEAVLQLAGSV
eukprot:SAG31_NODE_3730_length_3943_cov_2.667274_3_plen_61_part_00